MTNRTAAESKADNIAKKGPVLGAQYSVLWQEVASIHHNWTEFVELFHSNSKRKELMRRAALGFFEMVGDSLREGVLLHIGRLTDRSVSMGKANLTIQNLPDLVDDADVKKRVSELVRVTLEKTEFARDWRNRWIAHQDLKLALGEGTVDPLPTAQREQVDEALKAIVDVMNEVDIYFTGSETRYDLLTPHHGAVALLYVIDDGLKREDEREERRRKGDWSPDDFGGRDL
jgi:AbiU2